MEKCAIEPRWTIQRERVVLEWRVTNGHKIGVRSRFKRAKLTERQRRKATGLTRICATAAGLPISDGLDPGHHALVGAGIVQRALVNSR